jgi:hypothetical protein
VLFKKVKRSRVYKLNMRCWTMRVYLTSVVLLKNNATLTSLIIKKLSVKQRSKFED